MSLVGQQDCNGESAAAAVSVGMTDGRGRGLFASVDMQAGATILIERCARATSCLHHTTHTARPPPRLPQQQQQQQRVFLNTIPTTKSTAPAVPASRRHVRCR